MKAVKIWLILGVVMVFIQVIIGGITRLTGSGLSITEWDVLMGAIPPLNETQWDEAFEKYKQFPQYQLVNQHYELQEFKNIFWWEYIHRNWARLIGIVFIIPFVWFWFKRILDKSWKKKLLIVFALGALQGIMGWIMVASGLIEMPWVSPYNLTMHLLLALLVYSYLLWLAFGITNRALQKNFTALNRQMKWVLFFVVLQIAFGGFMAGTKAGMIYNTYPLMQGKIIPEGLFTHSSILADIFENTTTINFIHRTLAFIVLTVIGITFFRFRKVDDSPIRTLLMALVICIVLQFLLGVITLLNGSGGIPLGWGVMHQAGAFVCMAIITALLFYSKKRNTTAL